MISRLSLNLIKIDVMNIIIKHKVLRTNPVEIMMNQSIFIVKLSNKYLE